MAGTLPLRQSSPTEKEGLARVEPFWMSVTLDVDRPEKSAQLGDRLYLFQMHALYAASLVLDFGPTVSCGDSPDNHSMR